MVKGTTPTYILTLPKDIDLSDATNVYVTFKDIKNNLIMHKTGNDLEIDKNVINVFLTQSETLAFPEGHAYLQVNWTYETGGVPKRAATKEKVIEIYRNLYNEVIE